LFNNLFYGHQLDELVPWVIASPLMSGLSV